MKLSMLWFTYKELAFFVVVFFALFVGVITIRGLNMWSKCDPQKISFPEKPNVP